MSRDRFCLKAQYHISLDEKMARENNPHALEDKINHEHHDMY
jgi:hypothetical protein